MKKGTTIKQRWKLEGVQNFFGCLSEMICGRQRNDDFTQLIIKAVNDRTALLKALEDIIAECPKPKLPYGKSVTAIARAAIASATDHE